MPSDVDPRFEPEYQRGYDPKRHARTTRTPPKPHDAERPQPATTPPGPAIEVHVVESDDHVEPARRNPLIVALPILGLAFFAAGAFMIARLADSYLNIISGPVNSDDTAWNSVASVMLPAAVVGGVLCIVLWLVLLALFPRRRDA